MSGALLAAGIALAVTVAVGHPLLAGRIRPLGRGLEDDAPVRRWEGERARLIRQLQENDLALVEGRLDPAHHSATAARLSAEAEAVVARLRAAREELGEHVLAAVARPGRVASVLAVAAVLAAGWGAARLAQWQDIDLTGSPHADGSVPLDGVAMLPVPADLQPGGAEDGEPDIGAMVARLEARVAGGGASPEEIKMLLRSYDTLGRIAEARPVLDAALGRFPDDPDFQIGWLRAVVTLPREGDSARGLDVAERLIAAMPELLEARWYRSLFLVAEGRREEARAELMWMAPRLPEESPARRGVEELIMELSGEER